MKVKLKTKDKGVSVTIDGTEIKSGTTAEVTVEQYKRIQDDVDVVDEKGGN